MPPIANPRRRQLDGLSLDFRSRAARTTAQSTFRWAPPTALPPGPSEFVDRCLSTITSAELFEVSSTLLWWGDRCRVPDSDISEWSPSDITLCNLTGKYQPWYEGDKMQANYTTPTFVAPEICCGGASRGDFADE